MSENISIIVPMYNVEMYIDKCINSILDQTYRNFELLLIDDGSTDNTAAICKTYTSTDNRIQVISQNNKGVSSARNTGLRCAKGKFVLFVDADDYLEPEMVEVLYQAIDDSNSDVAICDIKYFDYQYKEIKVLKKSSGRTTIFTRDEAILALLNEKFFKTGPWAKLFRRDCIKEELFSEDIRIHEDKFFLYQAFKKINKVVYIDSALYGYVQRESSAMHESFNEKQFDRIKVTDMIYKDICNSHVVQRADADAFKALNYYYFLKSAFIASSFHSIYKKEIGNIRRRLKKIHLCNLPITRKYKMKIYFSTRFPGLYAMALRRKHE